MSTTRLAIVACVRDEADLLPAFLAYHHALGVCRAYLYLDACTDRTAAILRDWPWVEARPAHRGAGEGMEHLQHRCVGDALAQARSDGMEWLLHIDPDEFAWGGGLDDVAGRALVAGDLRAMLERARPDTEMVHLRPLEVVPVVRPAGAPFWSLQDVTTNGVIARDVFDPHAGIIRRLNRVIGHTMGKCAVRVAADVEAYSSHRWTRRQGVFPPAAIDIPTETLGWHFHYVVRDAASWKAKFAKFATELDVWSRGIPQEFPKVSWKKIAPRMSADEAERYFREWIAVPDDVLDDHRERGVVRRVAHVESVLREAGFCDDTGSPRPPRRRRCRVAFVAIDSGDTGLVRQWTTEGRLPTLARLLASSRTAITTSPAGFFVGAIWPSIVAAVGPGRHGRHSWQQLAPGTYEDVRVFANPATDPQPFWQALARAGRRVALLDVPLSGITPGFDGVQVLEWGCHDPEEGFRVQPASLATDILEAIGPHPVQGNCNAFRDAAGFATFRDDLVRGVALRTRLHRLLLARDDWDLFATVYGESHCVGHQCWHLHDPTHVQHDPAVTPITGDPILAVYEAIDASLADLLEAVGSDTTVVLLLSHGLKSHYDPTHLLDEMLARLDAAWRTRGPFLRHRRIARLARALLAGPRADRTMFPVENNKVDGAIWLNVAGREPHGRVSPGSGVDALCARLRADLSTFVNADTGRPLIARVERTADHYTGERLTMLPDLWVNFTQDGYIRRVASPLVGTITRDYDGCRTGDHTPEGLLAISGPGIVPGPLDHPIRVEDIAPTLAGMLGVSLDGIDGRPIDSYQS